EAIGRESVNSKLVVRLVGKSIITTQREPSCKTFGETDQYSLVFSSIPWTKCLYGPSREGRTKRPNPRSCREANISFAHTQHILHLSVIIIRFDQHVLDLLLDTNAVTCRKWRLDPPINIGGEELCRYCRMSQRPKRSPEKETRCFSDCRAGLDQVLIGSQTRQRLNIADIGHGIAWNKCVPGRHDAIKPINADEQSW